MIGTIWLGPSFRSMVIAVLRSQPNTQEPRDSGAPRVGVEDAGSHFTIRRVKDVDEKGDYARGVGAPKIANVGSWHLPAGICDTPIG
jgi:hypothetical protein